MSEQLALTWLIARRELRDQMRDWRILMPMLVLTIFFPFLMNYAARQAVNYINQYGANLVADRLIPFFILVVGFFPVTVSLVVALEAFVGEKERGTIEPLLASPLADWNLYVGKLIAGTLVPLATSYTGISLYLVGLLYQHIPWPDPSFILECIALTAVQTILMVSAAIVISTQSTTVRAANLLASFIVIPVSLLIQGESVLMFWGNDQVLWLAVVAVAIVAGLLIRLGLVHFKRESLLGREIDMLNLKWVGGAFWRAFSGSEQPPSLLRYLKGQVARLRKKSVEDGTSLTGALKDDMRGLLLWYRQQVFGALRKMGPAFWITLAIGVLSAVASFYYINSVLIPSHISPDNIQKLVKSAQDSLMVNSNLPHIPSSYLFFHNLRAELLILFFGLFTFGVGGLLLYVGNFAAVGALLSLSKLIGFSPLLVFLAGILPHGIFELPSIILASAAILYTGVRLVTPEERLSIGEMLIYSIADWAKIVIGICIPLLIVAALVEAHLTPIILLKVLGTTLSIQP